MPEVDNGSSAIAALSSLAQLAKVSAAISQIPKEEDKAMMCHGLIHAGNILVSELNLDNESKLKMSKSFDKLESKFAKIIKSTYGGN